MNSQQEKNLLIIKVGTNVLADTEHDSEKLNKTSFENIGREVRHLSDSGTGIILVSSGAITAGIVDEGKKRKEVKNAVELQRYAARGWDRVLQQWKLAIGDKRISSTMLTKREVHTKSMRDKALSVINCCLSHNDIFIVNENDTISDDEIKFGDNDTLAAALAVECINAGLFTSVKLLLLTNVGGLNKVAHDSTTLIRKVTDITSVEQYAGDATSNHSRGGMKTKVDAARTATRAGIETYITNGRTTRVITRTLDGEVGTRFVVS